VSNFSIRKIQPEDNAAVAKVIRKVMTEFGAVGPGFSIEDPEVDSMFEAYQGPRAVYYVVTHDNQVQGCGGLAPLAGGNPTICELKKMYFMPAIRGQGAGRVLAELLIVEARRCGFESIYIETLEAMTTANRLYQKLGFEPTGSHGNTGHCGCDRFYMLSLALDDDQSIVIH
jgi:putative acetyltransferase